jgi:hypothetical protein
MKFVSTCFSNFSLKVCILNSKKKKDKTKQLNTKQKNNENSRDNNENSFIQKISKIDDSENLTQEKKSWQLNL